MDISMENLTSEDVDQLHGLTLNIAFAIFIENWKWFDFPNTKISHLLLDVPLEGDKILDERCARYIGSGYYVFKDLPRYDKNIVRMINYGKKIVKAGYEWEYLRYIEKELNGSNHIQLLHCNAEIRCRSILKLCLDNSFIAEEL